jgi:hypothetical protein
MSYRMIRTSMSLDAATLEIMDVLAKQWSVSKAEIMRRAVRTLKAEADRETSKPSPLQALDWLQGGGGLSVKEGEAFKKAIRAEREAKRYWWEA